MSLELPLPPSVNSSYRMAGMRRFHSAETLRWYRDAVLLIRAWMIKSKTKPFTTQVHCDIEMYLRRRGSDSHNYLKIFIDGLQKAALVANDDLILPRIQSVEYDSKNPRIIATFTIKQETKT